jgi:hypothetical protein
VITARSTRRQPPFSRPSFRGPSFRGPSFRGPSFRGPSFRGFASRIVVVVALLAGVSVAVAPDSSLPASVRAVFGSCAEAAGGTVNVAIAVDPGVLPGAPRGPETLCVTVPDGATGADVLVERARLLGRPAPRWAPSGLMCAIDGYPANGCGERVDGAYLYWSYHLGDEGSWSYARTGPAMRRATPARMEGWHFIAGANSPADPPPRVSPSPSAVCPTAPPAPAPAPLVPSAGPGAAATPGSDVGGAGINPDGGSAAINGPGTGSTPGSGVSPGDDDASAIGDQPGPDDDGLQSGTSSEADASSDDAMASGRGPAMANAGSSDPTGSTGVPVAAMLLMVVVVALGVGATVRARRRSAL